MSRVSTFAGSSFSPDRMFRSTTAPVSKFLNLVRVNAAPLPGLTNWNSITVYGFPSIRTLRPLRISDVSYMARFVYPAPSAGCQTTYLATSLAGWLAVCDIHARGRCGALPPAAAARPGRVPGLRGAGRTRALSRRRARPTASERRHTLSIDEEIEETLPHRPRVTPDDVELEIFPLTKKPGASFPDRITIGRTANNDIVIADTSVSRLHAYVRRDGTRLGRRRRRLEERQLAARRAARGAPREAARVARRRSSSARSS